MRDEKIDLSALTKEKGQQPKFIGQVQEVTKEASETKSETDMSLDKRVRSLPNSRDEGEGNKNSPRMFVLI